MRALRNALHAAISACALSLTIGATHAQAPKPLSYVDILHQLTDLDRVTQVAPGYRAGLFSSWDRNGRKVWGANGDCGQYLRTEKNGEAVMMDIDGPGVVYRTWSANPMGKIRIYLDGSTTPNYEWRFPDLFDGKTPPFVKPLVYRRDYEQSASDCYLPIPFAKHIKITADKAQQQYYQFNYLLYPKDQVLPSFHLPLSPQEQGALDGVAYAWSHCGENPNPRLPDQKTITKKVTIKPGGKVDIFAQSRAGVIRGIRMKMQSDQRYAWRKLVLKGTWDDAAWPQVLTPLGPFFGFDWETPEYASVTTGCVKGQTYQFWPMPYRKSAKLSICSFLEMPATVECEIEYAPVAKQPDDMAYFFARWRHEPDSTTFDYPFLETAGHGHFVGVSMPIDHPLDGWWGEGDEKVWVDDDYFPPWIGTGSEDYFGDAWGIRYLPGPSFGAASMKGHRTCNYRWHFMDQVPFEQRMRMTIENYGPNGGGPRGQYDYSSTAFWYQTELTPAFAELKDVEFMGGNDPYGKPYPMTYNPDTFSDLTADSVRTYGLGIIFTQQAETLLADQVKAGKARIITDAKLGYEFDRERAVEFGKVKAGQTLAEITVNSDANRVYYPTILTAPETGIADLSVAFGGKISTISSRPQKNQIELNGLYLAKGAHKVALVALNEGRAVFDAIQFSPAPGTEGVTEAEELTIVGATNGADKPAASDAMRGVSAGRVLVFSAKQAGQGFTVTVPKRGEAAYVLAVRAIMGPKAGTIQAFSNGKAIGPQFDLYSSDRHVAPANLPLGPVPTDAKEVEIRVVGHNASSQGYDAELDYFRWDPDIIGPGTAEGVWAQVIGTHDCEYRAQEMGGGYSGGHQFWLQPCNDGGYADIALEIPRDGNYELVVKYTHSWDYAMVQASLDGKPIGGKTDTYAETVQQGDPLSLGKFDLTAGRHVLRFQATGHNALSKGYLIGIDHVIVK